MVFEATSTSFQKLLDNGSPFPLVLIPSKGSPKTSQAIADALQTKEQKSWLHDCLAKSGAILLRGFEVWTAKDLDLIIDALEWKEYPYMEIGGFANRKRVYGKVLTANDLPLDLYVGFHNEASYLEKSPARIAFFCTKPPDAGTGGATPIVPGHVVYKRVVENQDLAEKLLNRGHIRHTSFLSEQNWKIRLKAEDKGTAEINATKINLTVSWLPDGGAILESRNVGPLFKKDSAGRMAIFTSVGTYVEFVKRKGFTKTTFQFEDGTLLSDETSQELVRIMLEEEVAFPWEKGDILLIDNSAVLHSRQKCTAREREILVCLGE